MTQHNIAEAKAHFSELIQKTLLGEEVIIAKGNRPIAKIVPLASDEDIRIPVSPEYAGKSKSSISPTILMRPSKISWITSEIVSAGHPYPALVGCGFAQAVGKSEGDYWSAA